MHAASKEESETNIEIPPEVPTERIKELFSNKELQEKQETDEPENDEPENNF